MSELLRALAFFGVLVLIVDATMVYALLYTHRERETRGGAGQ